MKKLLFILIVLMAFPAWAAQKESAFERVLRTGTIRCGYTVYDPIIIKDPNTGVLSGLLYDYMENMGKRLGLKVEWALEINLTTYLQDLQDGKYDMECSGGWPNARRARVAEYTKPIAYFPVYFYTQAGNTAYDGKFAAINNAKTRFVTIPGDYTEDYWRDVVPQSMQVSVDATLAAMVVEIISGKGDVALWDAPSARAAMQEHPGKLRRVDLPPAKVTPINTSVAKGEFALKSMIDEAAQEMIFDGVIEQLLAKYHLTPDIAFRPARPYDAPQ